MSERRFQLTAINKAFTLPGRSLRTRRVLREVDVIVRRGEIVALVGESGSGKTTVARVMCRLVSPDSGEMLIDGINPLKSEPRRPSLEFRRRVQMIFQDPFASLNPVHSIAHHIERPLLLHKLATKANMRASVIDRLTEVGLTPAEEYIDRYPHELSGGQRQRVAIARALATNPEYLLADEPTSMLDVATRRGILDLLYKLARDRELGVLFVTHDLLSAQHLADRTLVMYAGRIVERGPTLQVLTAPGHPYTSLLIHARPGPEAGFRDPPPTTPASYEAADDGCPYAPRCPKAESACRSGLPAPQELHPDHTASCRIPETYPTAS